MSMTIDSYCGPISCAAFPINDPPTGADYLRNALSVPVIVETRDALREIFPQLDKAVILIEDGFEAIYAIKAGPHTEDADNIVLNAPGYYATRIVTQLPPQIIIQQIQVPATSRSIPDLRDWDGLDLSGNNDNASLVQAAFNTTAAAGEEIRIPAGVIAIGSKITLPPSVRVVGNGSKGIVWAGVNASPDSLFHITHSGVGFEAVGTYAPRSVQGISTYRTQPVVNGAPWVAGDYGFDFNLIGCNDVDLTDINLINPTRGINAGGGCGRIRLNRIKGQPLYKGVEIHNCYDVVWMDEIGFWPFWSNDVTVRNYMRANAASFHLHRVDNPKVGRIFSIGYRYTVKVNADVTTPSLPGGTLSKGYFDTIGGDSAGTCIYIDEDCVSANLQVGKCYSLNGSWVPGASYLIRDRGAGTYMTFGALELGMSKFSLIYQDGTNGVLLSSHTKAYLWDNDGTGDCAFVNTPGNQMHLGTIVKPSTSAQLIPPSCTGITYDRIITQ